MTTLQTSYDLIVVGGGIVGASVAFHAAQAGASTLLVDRHDVGRATNAGAGILAPEMNRRDPGVWFDFAVNAVGYYPELIGALDALDAGETSYAVCGMLLVAATEDELDAFTDARRHILDRQAARHAPSVDDLYPISSGEARELFPPLREVCGALYYRSAARIDGRQLADALVTGGQRYGLTLLNGNVERLLQTGNHVQGVVTAEGNITAATTVIAGGAWSKAFGQQLDVAIPVEPQRGQIAHLELTGMATAQWPIVGAMQSQYIVAWPQGRIAIGATRETGSGYNIETTAAGLYDVLGEGLRVAPGLSSARLLEVRVGLRPLPPDGLPVLGTVPGKEGVLLATGHGPTGLQLGPYSGKLMAELALGNAPTANITQFGIERFATGHVN